MFFSPSIEKISDGISRGSSALWFASNSWHEYPVISSAPGLKKVIGTVAESSAMKPLKLYLHIFLMKAIICLFLFLADFLTASKLKANRNVPI